MIIQALKSPSIEAEQKNKLAKLLYEHVHTGATKAHLKAALTEKSPGAAAALCGLIDAMTPEMKIEDFRKLIEEVSAGARNDLI